MFRSLVDINSATAVFVRFPTGQRCAAMGRGCLKILQLRLDVIDRLKPFFAGNHNKTRLQKLGRLNRGKA